MKTYEPIQLTVVQKIITTFIAQKINFTKMVIIVLNFLQLTNYSDKQKIVRQGAVRNHESCVCRLLCICFGLGLRVHVTRPPSWFPAFERRKEGQMK